MSVQVVDKSQVNRRKNRRIFEQVNLFYRQISHNSIEGLAELGARAESTVDQQMSDSVDNGSFLPDSQIQENDSLHVNLSASGISFTCRDAMQPGDVLFIRVLLLNCLTMISSCCRVVYCRPSNPYEKNRYPYTIGAQFMNLQKDDQAFLSRYVQSKRNRQWCVAIVFSLLLLTMLYVPDLVFGLFLDLFDTLLHQLLGFIHLAYEVFEYSLDLAVETLFHTTLYQTQLIGFYVQIVIGLALGYFLITRVPKLINRWFNLLLAFIFRKKSSVQYFWKCQSFLYKAGMICVGLLLFLTYFLFFI